MRVAHIKSSFLFWFFWVLIGILSSSLVPIFFLMLSITPSAISEAIIPISGAVGSIWHWVLLRRYLPEMTAWVRVSILGWVAGYIVCVIAAYYLGPMIAFPLSPTWLPYLSLWKTVVFGGLLGTVVGLYQWHLLRHHISCAGWWIAASSAGWALALLNIFINTEKAISNYIQADLIVANGYIYSAITGFAMLLLLRISRRRK
ncbi:MAG: hypothetical protein OEZ02_01605 [Anaerolineae bacterium]|nr:hypothetical protein [Anaerolineae bacterium]